MQKTFHSTLAALALALSLVSVHVLLLFDFVRTLLQLFLLALFLCFSLSLDWAPVTFDLQRGKLYEVLS